MRPGLRILYLLVLLASLLACNSQTEKPLRVGTIPWAGYELLYLARDLEYYDNDRIKLKELTSTTETLQAFRQGQLDVIAITLDEALGIMEYQSDLKIILIFNISNGADKLIVGPNIRTLAELKDKRIAVEQSGVGGFMLSQILLLAQLDPDDIRIIPATVNKHFAMLDQQLVDAVISFDPTALKLQQQGYLSLVDSRQLPGAIIDVLVTRDSGLKQQQKNIRDLLKGYWKARDYMAANPQDALMRMAPRLDVSTADLELLYQNLVLPEREQQQYLFNQPLETTIESLNKLMIEMGLLEKTIDSRPLFVDVNMD